MCGIAGLILPQRARFHGTEPQAIVGAMTAALAHRGPDDRGLWADPDSRCVLGHRRLSVIDTSAAGHQPFLSGDGRWTIVFNGEIYNFRELRPLLSSKGSTFRSRSDTEVLVEAVARWGVEGIKRLDGMFAFAAFDTLTGETLLARDPFGEKPLYYMPLPDQGVAFASELQALQLVPGFDQELDLDAMAEVLCFQYIGAPRSVFSSVRKLPAGHWMKVDARGAIQIERYFAFEPGSDTIEGRPTDDLVDEVEDILVRSLRRRLIADVPLGAFLSGGVDSSTVCALAARKLDRRLTTFSVGFRDHPESEHEAAASFARSIGTDHRTLLLDPRAAQSIPQLGALLDEPNGDSSCLPTLLLSEFARQDVTVALSGDGGDEMFAGYARYGSVVDETADALRRATPCRPGDAYYGSRLLVGNEHQIWGLFGEVPSAFAAQLKALRADLDRAQPSLIAAMRRHDVDRYLPGAVLAKVDRMSMRHALEVRTPFLSVELAQFAQRIPDRLLIDRGRSKVLLRELAYRYLPRHLVDLPKQGFGLPQSGWTSATLYQLSASLVEGDDGRLGELFGRARVSEFMRNGRESGSLSVYFLWSLLIVEAWLRAHVHPPPVDLRDGVRLDAVVPPPKVAEPVRVEAVGAGVFVLSSSATDDPQEPLARRLSAPLMGRLIELATPGPSPQPAALELPGWGEPLSDEHRRRLAPLRGGVVAFRAPDAQRIDHSVLARLSALGVARVLGENPHALRGIDEWALQPHRQIQRAINLSSLWRGRLVAFSRRWPMRVLFRRRPSERSAAIAAAAASRELAALFQPSDGASFGLDPGDPIVVCTHGLTPGGAERQWIYLAQALGEAGYEVTLLTFTPLEGRNAEYLPLVEELGINLFDATSVDDLDALRFLPPRPRLSRLVEATSVEHPADLIRVTSALARLKPKAVFAQLDDPNLLCALGGRFCGIPRIVMSFRNYNPTRLGWIDRSWYLPAYQLVAPSGAVRLTGNSRDANADYADWIGVPRERVHHIPNVIEPRHLPLARPEEARSLRSSLAVDPGSKVVLGVFRLYPEKDPFTFLDVARRLIALIPDVRVLVAGDGPMRAAMEERIVQHGIGARVTLLGDRKDVGSLMTIADLILMTSRLEGMSNVAVEAQLSATPLVATGIPGIASVVRNGETALLCPAGDVEAFSTACLELLQDEPRARAMGASGRMHVLRSFTTDGLADRYLNILHSDF